MIIRQRILIVGGGGAVGLCAIQLAVAGGCHVSTTCGNESVDRALAAGAEQAVDYTAEDVEVAIRGYFDAVLDTIGTPEAERIGIYLLKRGGHYMTLQVSMKACAIVPVSFAIFFLITCMLCCFFFPCILSRYNSFCIFIRGKLHHWQTAMD